MVCIVESWLDGGVSDAELSENGRYAVFRRDRGERGGGVFVLVNKKPRSTQPALVFSSELVCVVIYCDGESFRLMAAYSAGTGDTEHVLSEMSVLISDMDAASETDLPLLIVGDFNCPKISWHPPSVKGCSTREKLLFDFVELNGLEQKVRRPTRPRSGNILDLVICSSDLVEDDQVVLHKSPVPTDHYAIVVHLAIACDPAAENADLRDWNKADLQRMVDSLSNTDWLSLLSPRKSVEDIYRLFLDRLRAEVESYVPCRTLRERGSIETHVSRLLNRIECCSDETELAILRKKLLKARRRQRCILENTIVSSRDPARFFGYAATRLRLKDDLSLLISPCGARVLRDEDKANLLCDHFEDTYLKVSNYTPSSSAVIVPRGLQVVEDVDVSEEAVAWAIADTKNTWSSNPEGFPATFIKRIAAGIVKPLSIIYRRSLDDGAVPSTFKTAYIAPVHKKGLRSDPANKRPVSLTAVTCRVLEKLICRSVLQNAESQGLISKQQFAYRSRKSTTDCLLSFTNFVANAINRGDNVDVVYTDYKNAFETMPHDLLVSVLPLKAVGGRLKRWISEFLSGRTFRVKIRGSLSRVAYASTGCPQGTVLGAVLFMLFIDQLKMIVPEKIRFYVYADDIKFAAIVKDESDRSLLQSLLTDFAEWSKMMGMTLSVNKCSVMHFGKETHTSPTA